MSKHDRSSKKERNKGDDETNIINFTFCDNKHAFDSYLVDPHKCEPLIEDKNDFWKFVNKYESMLRNAGQAILSQPLDNDDLNSLRPFHKRKLIPLQFKDKSHESRQSSVYNRNASLLKIKQFEEIVLIFLDFKQKEKFSKLKKLRKTQKNLPISRFKDQMRASLEKSQILIVAGDTGCGKSTQVPQYLYEFGYKNIGNVKIHYHTSSGLCTKDLR